MKALAALLVAILLSGCAQQQGRYSAVAAACIEKCLEERAQGIDLAAGPCLLDPMPSNQSWVCDVAHDPRSIADNNPANQCSSFGTGLTRHFVEVTPECRLIREA